MGLTINPTITFTGTEAKEGILEAAFDRPMLSQVHTIHENIIAKEQIAFLQRLQKVTLKDTGCGTGISTKELPMYQKFWEPVNTKIWLQPCWADFEASFFIWSMRKGIDRADLSETDLAEYLIEVLTDAVYDDALRMLWFGDEAITDIGDSPVGTLALSSDVKYYDLFDGFFKQVFAGVAITNPATWGHIPKYVIAANAEATKALQLSQLADGHSLTIMRHLLDNADERLRNAPNKIFLVTNTIFSNWQDYKESKVLETSWKQQDYDMETGVYRNTPIIPMSFWDRHIQGDFDNGTTYNIPHRAILTTKEQLAAGFDSSDKVGDFKSFLDDTTELYNIKGGYKIDAKTMEHYMFSVAY